MKYKAILFDLDYTLVDATQGILLCTKDAMAKLDVFPTDDAIKNTIGMSFYETYTTLTNNHNKDNAIIFERLFLQKAKECLTENTNFYVDAIFALKYFKMNNIQLALVTSKYRAEVIELLDKHKLLNIFDAIVTGDDIENPKPNPEPILLALHKLSLEKNDAVYVGDNMIDSLACEAAKIDFIGVTTGTTPKETLKKGQHLYIVTNLTELVSLSCMNFLIDSKRQESCPHLIRELQNIINNHIENVGGYWAPEFGLARLFEEVSELFRCFIDNSGNFGEEIADIFIISTCLANQYCSNLSNQTKHKVEISDIQSLINQLVIITGEISRTVNCYEGRKLIKANENIHSIEELISKLHSVLFTIAESKNVNLYQEICKKIIKRTPNHTTSVISAYDPSSSLSANTFKLIQKRIPCVYANNAKMWGAPEWLCNESIDYNVNNLVSSLSRFSKICSNEGLDVYVVAAPAVYGENIAVLAKFLKSLLFAIANSDKTNNCMQQKIDDPQWQYTFNNTRLFVTTFAPCYSSNSSRYNYGLNCTFVVFQPESSFNKNKIPRGMDTKVRDKIRGNFIKNGQEYDNKIMQSTLEAIRYIKPLDLGDAPIRWWESEIA
ncbi:MAG: HAD-IA family hydrolase [Rickettsiaceae bacterium]|nr:HAD-IA family hydrolase [Rickettsiaceae bacterium]